VTSKLLNGLNVAAVAVSPNGGTLYALSSESLSFTIANTSTGAVENTIALPKCNSGSVVASSIAISPTGEFAFVIVNSVVYGSCGSVVPINLMTQQVATPFPGPTGSALAVSPTTGDVWASAGSSIDVIDVSTNQLVGTIPIAASAIVFSPDGTKAYAAGSQNGVSGTAVVDTSSLAVISFIPGTTSSGGQSIAVTPDGLLIYVAGGAVIYSQSLQVVGQFGLGPPVVIH